MFGNVLVTKQTGEEGKQVNRLLITSCQKLKVNFTAVLLDRALGKPIIMASSEGGIDVEEVAEATPKRSSKKPWTPTSSCRTSGPGIAIALGLRGKLVGQCGKTCRASRRMSWLMLPWWKSTAGTH